MDLKNQKKKKEKTISKGQKISKKRVNFFERSPIFSSLFTPSPKLPAIFLLPFFRFILLRLKKKKNKIN